MVTWHDTTRCRKTEYLPKQCQSSLSYMETTSTNHLAAMDWSVSRGFVGRWRLPQATIKICYCVEVGTFVRLTSLLSRKWLESSSINDLTESSICQHRGASRYRRRDNAMLREREKKVGV